MNTYCVKCRKDAENLNPKMVRTKNGRLLMQSKCTVCGIKKSRFVQKQEAMNEIVNKFLLTDDKFMPEVHKCILDLLIKLVVHLPKTKKELKSL